MSTVQLDTPPPTPEHEELFWSEHPVPKKRQSRDPVQTPTKQLDLHVSSNFAVINFELQQPLRSGLTPSLAIVSGTTVKKVRRRLWDVCEPLEHVDLDIRKRKRPSTAFNDHHVNRKLICSFPLTYYNGTDADDEMERSTLNDTSFLSPPYSPCYSEVACSDPPERESTKSLIKHCFRAQQTSKTKSCASCKTKKTPLWRDSEDGTPYCNACGIRLRKYHISCSVCHYIPRKDEKMNNCCCLCGSRLVHL